MAETAWVDSGGVGIHVELAGEETAPALLLLHGWPETHRCWDSVAPILADRYRLLMPDMRGFGRSDMPGGTASYAMPLVTADALAVLSHFGVERAGVVAHDFGGAVAWALGAFAPQAVSAMVVISSPHPLQFRAAALADPRQWRRSFYVWLMQAGGDGEALLRSGGFTTLARWAFAGSQVPETLIAEYRASWAEPGRFSAMAEWYRSNFRPALFDPDAPDPSLPPVTVPTSYLHGEHDPAFVADAATGSGRFVEAPFEERVVAGAGHWLPHDEPDLVAGTVRAWMERFPW